jgi:hypothetical protein
VFLFLFDLFLCVINYTSVYIIVFFKLLKRLPLFTDVSGQYVNLSSRILPNNITYKMVGFLDIPDRIIEKFKLIPILYDDYFSEYVLLDFTDSIKQNKIKIIKDIFRNGVNILPKSRDKLRALNCVETGRGDFKKPDEVFIINIDMLKVN